MNLHTIRHGFAMGLGYLYFILMPLALLAIMAIIAATPFLIGFSVLTVNFGFENTLEGIYFVGRCIFYLFIFMLALSIFL